MSTRVFGLKTSNDRRPIVEPYTWASTVRTRPDGRQRYLTQEMHIENVRTHANPQRQAIEFGAQASMVKPHSGEVCPVGFELQQARVSGSGRSALEALHDYCQGKSR